MPHKRLLLCILFACCAHIAAAQYVYDYNENCSKAYKLYMALQQDGANEVLRQEIKENPHNLVATYLADYDDCLLLLFNGDKNDFNQRIGHFDERLDLLSRGNDKDPWYRFAKAGIYLHWALVYVRMGENLKAGMNFRRSFMLLKENRKQFPSFEYNNVLWGVEQAVIGTVPDEYKWVASVLGLKGSVKTGAALLEKFITHHKNGDLLYNEALVYLVYLKFYLMYQQDEAWRMVSNSSLFPLNNNIVNLFVKANIALNYRKADAAIQTLKQVQAVSGSQRYPVFDFEYASALFLKLDNNSISHFRNFLSRYKGGIFIKESWLRMAYVYYIQGDMQQANYCLQQVQQKGGTQVDADKQALRIAKAGKWPRVALLQVRLLIDGGYYAAALAKLNTINKTDLKDVAEQLEYNFRMARIHDETGNDNAALQYYQFVTDKGREREEYFAARAALQSAFIFERRGEKSKALSKYEECLDMDRHDFKNSIDQQAKAGINRLSLP